ncbi:MAG TPA: hypothetical protein VKA39_08955, partial [Beijerinckiaceae bacterium]|nr:hypothetical protein [Beijerinckiaceae bacterium]
MDGYPQLAKNALSVVSGRAEEMLRRVQEMATEPADQRIARALLRLARDAGRPLTPGPRSTSPCRARTSPSSRVPPSTP